MQLVVGSNYVKKTLDLAKTNNIPTIEPTSDEMETSTHIMSDDKLFDFIEKNTSDTITNAIEDVIKNAKSDDKTYVLKHIYESRYFDALPESVKSHITEMLRSASKNDLDEINFSQFSCANELRDHRKFEADYKRDTAPDTVTYSNTYNVALCNISGCTLL